MLAEWNIVGLPPLAWCPGCGQIAETARCPVLPPVVLC
jgi:hypothetical protein